MVPRHIAVVTGSRAEYGLLRNLIREVAADPALRLSVLVTGSHLSDAHGRTAAEIEADGVPIAAAVDLGLADDSPRGILAAMARALDGLAEALTSLRPDVLVVLGDRYEAYCAAQCAMVLGIPIAHIHGGERTQGVIDEAIRHSITKMAHLHFVAAAEYGRRVEQMGEAPERVFNVGAPALDSIAACRPFLAKAELESSLGIALGPRNLLITYHPVTLDPQGPVPATTALLSALDSIDDGHFIFTGANADAHGRTIDRLIAEFVARHPGRAWSFASLGQKRYFSLVSVVDAVVGNSSSGLIEVPLLGKPTVNVGPRQEGRLAPPSVISCAADAPSIKAALTLALSPTFAAQVALVSSPYGTAGASKRMKDILATLDLGSLLVKEFHDLPRR